MAPRCNPWALVVCTPPLPSNPPLPPRVLARALCRMPARRGAAACWCRLQPRGAWPFKGYTRARPKTLVGGWRRRAKGVCRQARRVLRPNGAPRADKHAAAREARVVRAQRPSCLSPRSIARPRRPPPPWVGSLFATPTRNFNPTALPPRGWHDAGQGQRLAQVQPFVRRRLCALRCVPEAGAPQLRGAWHVWAATNGKHIAYTQPTRRGRRRAQTVLSSRHECFNRRAISAKEWSSTGLRLREAPFVTFVALAKAAGAATAPAGGGRACWPCCCRPRPARGWAFASGRP
jgi:hypothetical protein